MAKRQQSKTTQLNKLYRQATILHHKRVDLDTQKVAEDFERLAVRFEYLLGVYGYDLETFARKDFQRLATKAGGNSDLNFWRVSRG